MSFEAWMSEVDRIISSKIGLSSADLRDRAWRDLYDDGLTPAEAVEDEIGDLDSDEGLEEAIMDELFG